MSCFGDREKGPPEHTQKWDYITLSEFKCTSTWTALGYAWLWFMAIVAVAVYILDTFIVFNLLAFSKWSSQVQPALPFQYSRWIFAGCILLSWALAIYEWIRAVRVIKRNGIAESYMDPLAVRLQSMKGRGWKRFLVFTELTKSKKGVDYIAFFVYFAFQGAVRVILAEGPRQCVNAMTLYAVLTADLLANGSHPKVIQFFLNIKTLADQHVEEALTYASMLFTLIIWVFSALSLILAVILYLVFLWHYVPQEDGRLSIYCRRKIDKRLARIVEHKVKAAFEEEERQNRKVQQKAELHRQKTGEVPPMPGQLVRQPTLPNLCDATDTKHDDKLSDVRLTRQNTGSTVSTLPPYSKLPATSAQNRPTLPDVDIPSRPPMPSRPATSASGFSNSSYASDAPLLENAGHAGDATFGPRNPSQFARQNSNGHPGQPFFERAPTAAMPRMGTPASERTMSPVTGGRPPYRQGTPGPPQPGRSNTGFSLDREGRSTPHPMGPENGFIRPPPGRSNTGFSLDEDMRSTPRPMTPQDTMRPPFAPPARQNSTDTFQSMTSTRTGDRPFPGPPGPLSRPPTSTSVYSQQSVSRKPTPASFHRPFSPASMPDGPSLPLNSFEMVSHPSHSGPRPQTPDSSVYKAFSPNLIKQSSTVEGVKAPQQSLSPSYIPEVKETGVVHTRQASQQADSASNYYDRTSAYGDILDEYGPVTPTEEKGFHFDLR